MRENRLKIGDFAPANLVYSRNKTDINSTNLNLYLITNKPALFRASNRLPETTTLGTPIKKWGIVSSGIICHFQTYLTKRGGEMYILLFNTCVKFHAKICTYY